MPRAERLDIPGLLQHVMVRGIEKRKIFLDDEDREWRRRGRCWRDFCEAMGYRQNQEKWRRLDAQTKAFEIFFSPACSLEEVLECPRRQGVLGMMVMNNNTPCVRMAIDSLASLPFSILESVLLQGPKKLADGNIFEFMNHIIRRRLPQALLLPLAQRMKWEVLRSHQPYLLCRFPLHL